MTDLAICHISLIFSAPRFAGHFFCKVYGQLTICHCQLTILHSTFYILRLWSMVYNLNLVKPNIMFNIFL